MVLGHSSLQSGIPVQQARERRFTIGRCRMKRYFPAGNRAEMSCISFGGMRVDRFVARMSNSPLTTPE